jgi:hypothetical protein
LRRLVDALLRVFKALFGSAMAPSIVLGTLAILGKDVSALGAMGAGTLALIQLPAHLPFGEPGDGDAP